MANEQFVSRYRKYGEEQPYWKAGIFKIRLPFVHYKWSVPEMVQAVFMCATCLGAIPVLQEVLGVSYGVALSMVIINGFFYNLHVLLGDPVVPGWITPAIPIITAFLTDGYEMGPERTQALIAMQLILGLIFLVFGITGIGGKMVHLVPNSVKAGVLMGGGLAAIIGEMGETGRFWTYPISITVGVLVAYFCLFGMLPAIIIGVVLGPIAKEIAVPAVQLWPLIKIPEFGNIWNQLSPFAIGWKAKPASGPVVTPGTGSTGTTPGGSTGSNTGSNTNAGNSSNTAAGNAGGTAAAASGTAKPAGAADNKAAVPAKSGLIPQTSDSFPLLPVAGIALVSLAAVGLLALLKKKKHETR